MEDVVAADSYTRKETLMKPMRKVFVSIYPVNSLFSIKNLWVIFTLSVLVFQQQILVNCFRFVLGLIILQLYSLTAD